MEYLGNLLRPLTMLHCITQYQQGFDFELGLPIHKFTVADNVVFQVRIKFHQTHGHTHIFVWFERMHVLLGHLWPLCLHDTASALCQGIFPYQTSMLSFHRIRSLLCFAFQQCVLPVKDYIMCIRFGDYFLVLNEMFHLILYFYPQKNQ